MAELTPEKRAEIQALVDAATPPPWEQCGNHVRTKFNGSGGFIVAECPVADPNHTANAAFIADTRETVPALMAENARLEEEIEFFIEYVLASHPILRNPDGEAI